MNEPLTPEQLAALLKREFESADSYYDQLKPMQTQAFSFYEAQPFGGEIDGRSQTVLPDVQEAIDSANAAILKAFASGDRTVEFEATDEADEQAVDDATAAIDYNFMRRQDGYRVLHDVCSDGLLKKYGIFKAACEESERVSRERVTGDPLQLGMLPEGAEVEEVTENEDGTVTATIKTQRIEKRHLLHAVPVREFRFSALARHEDSADYLAHVRAVTRSEVVEMGFDKDQVYDLPTCSADMDDDLESDNLDHVFNEESSPALERVLLCEEYARVDVDGDGIAERVKCYRVENEILIDAETGKPSIETVDEQPFAIFCPFPRPHRIIGYSLADKVMDIQYARSHIARQLHDGMAYANMPRMVVSESGSSNETLDDILSPRPGAPIRVRDASAVVPVQTPFDVGKSLQVMEWISREKEGRTGISRAGSTLDENSLNPQTATEFMGRQSQGENLQELMARNLAEALSRGFAKLYRMMRQDAEPFSIKVDGKFREVDPASWPEDVNMRVRVGLGSSGKDKQTRALAAISEPLQISMQEGLSGPEHAFNWMDRMARAMDIGQGEDFMFDPSDPERQQQQAAEPDQPDPAVLEAQAKMQAEQAKAQGQMQLDRMKAQASMDAERERNAMQMEVAREKAQLEAELARDKAEFEAELARDRASFEQRMAMVSRDVDLRNNRPGGDLDK